MSLAQIAALTHGRVTDAPDPQVQVTEPLAFDSRAVQSGALFACLPGERADGHDYAPAAITNGAVAALVTRPVGVPAIIVDDVLTAMADLARAVAAELPKTTVVAITGSAGKTSTKDLLQQILERLAPTVATERSFNNEIGLPVTVLRAQEDTRFLVLEMGARGIGHIRHLTNIVRPHVSAVLCVGTAHIGEFGTADGIAQAKGEIIEALPHADAGGVAVLNADDPLVAAMASRTRARILLFGRSPHAHVRAEDVQLADGRARFTLHTPTGSAPVHLRLYGEHHLTNALAAATLALAADADITTIADVLNTAQPLSSGRMQVLDRPDGVTIVNDAYNANPDSMRASLRAVAVMAKGRRIIAVLGEMLELGDASADAHRQVVREAAAAGVQHLVVVGDTHATAMADEARAARIPVDQVPDKADVVPLLGPTLTPGDLVLVKGGNAIGMEHTARHLHDHSPK